MEQETSCINSRVILDYIKEHNNGDLSDLLKNLDPRIDLLPDPEGFLEDPNNWISCTVVSKLFKRAKLIFNDEGVPYKIAQYAVEKTDLGFKSLIVKVFGSHNRALKNAQRINTKWNKSKEVELVKINRNDAIIRLHWNPRMDVSKDICLYNQGAYTFIPTTWGGKPLSLKEEKCYFEGSPYCEYHLKWITKNRFQEIFSRFFAPKSILMKTIKEIENDKKIIEQKYGEVYQLNVELNQKIKQIVAIQETGKAILSVLDLKQLLTVIMNILSNVCKIHRAIIMLVNENERQLEYIYGTDYSDKVPKEVKNYTVSLDRLSNILARVTNTGRSEYVPEVNSSSLRKENIMLTHVKPTSVYVVPLITRSKVIGVIATDAIDGRGVPQETRETLEVFAPHIAIAIENARLYSRLQEQMAELKKSQALLSRSEKFSFLGNLAARLAHEIKNPMTAIGTFIQMMPQKYDDQEFRENFHMIALEETGRINNLITELLDLVKKRESHFEFNSLHDLIEKMILLVSPQSNAKRIDVSRRFDPNIGQVWMDSEKIKEVILNLLSNAVDFTPEGGKIEFTTKNCIKKGCPDTICIEIKDNGLGIPQSMIDNVFDPYFTTKHKSSIHNGTGLGLFIAHQNMQDHDGIIEVKSKVNKGTVFTLTLPVDNSNQSLPSIDARTESCE
ncbi:MAG: ATP-binding protein, partial [Desulfobacteraceae bacterium]|nr:ATP-binding protein [Desulfobacteraceae bacterium]